MDRSMLSLNEVASLLHISAATVNYYTNIGLFRVSSRKGNRRLYDKAEVLRRIDKIKEMRSQGYPLVLIRQMLEEQQK